MLPTRLTAAALLIAVLAEAAPVGAASHRVVQIRWDFLTTRQEQRLAIQVDDAPPLRSPDADAFVLRASDRVTLVAVFAAGSEPPDVSYAVTGRSLDDKDLAALRKLFGAPAAPSTSRLAGERLEPDSIVRAVVDPLVPGGRLAVSFASTAGGRTSREDRATIDFRIQAAPPRLTASYGMAFSTAASPVVAIANTASHERVIAMRDADETLKPIQSLVTFANFHVTGPLYASAGVPLNDKLFESPMLGGTIRIPAGRLALDVVAGVQFSRETQIVPSSGFYVGQVVEGSAMTADAIPTQERWRQRFVVGLTIDLQ